MGVCGTHTDDGWSEENADLTIDVSYDPETEGAMASVVGRSCMQTRRAAGPARATVRTPRVSVAAAAWREVERSTPLIQANGQPIMAPRTDGGGDPYAALLRQRTIFMSGEVEDFGADALVSQLLLLDAQEQAKDIRLFINSPGGSVSAGMGIYDAMMLCRSDVSTFCFGLAASMGAFLLGAGTRGKRYSMPNSRIMIHQPLGGASGQAVDIEIQAKEIMYHKANLNRIIADYSGQPLAKVEEDTDRDRYMSPIEAKEYGIIDHIVGGESATFNSKELIQIPAIKIESEREIPAPERPSE